MHNQLHPDVAWTISTTSSAEPRVPLFLVIDGSLTRYSFRNMKLLFVTKSEARLSMDQNDLEAKEGLLQTSSSSIQRPTNRHISYRLVAIIIGTNLLVLSVLALSTIKYNGTHCRHSRSDGELEP